MPDQNLLEAELEFLIRYAQDLQNDITYLNERTRFNSLSKFRDEDKVAKEIGDWIKAAKKSLSEGIDEISFNQLKDRFIAIAKGIGFSWELSIALDEFNQKIVEESDKRVARLERVISLQDRALQRMRESSWLYIEQAVGRIKRILVITSLIAVCSLVALLSVLWTKSHIPREDLRSSLNTAIAENRDTLRGPAGKSWTKDEIKDIILELDREENIKLTAQAAQQTVRQYISDNPIQHFDETDIVRAVLQELDRRQASTPD